MLVVAIYLLLYIPIILLFFVFSSAMDEYGYRGDLENWESTLKIGKILQVFMILHISFGSVILLGK